MCLCKTCKKGLVAAISAMAPIASLYLDRGLGDQELDQLGDNIFDAIHLIALRNIGLTNRRKEIIKPSRKCEADMRVADEVLKRKNNIPQQLGQQQGQKAQPQRQKKFKHVSNATWERGIRIHRSNTAISIRCRAISIPFTKATSRCLNSSSMVSGLCCVNSIRISIITLLDHFYWTANHYKHAGSMLAPDLESPRTYCTTALFTCCRCCCAYSVVHSRHSLGSSNNSHSTSSSTGRRGKN